MKIDELPRLIESRHVLLVGADPVARHAAVESFLRRCGDEFSQVIRLPSGMQTSGDYVWAAKELFPIVSPLGIAKAQMTFDQVWDMHLDWTGTVERVLILWEEVDGVGQEWLAEILSDYVSEKVAHEQLPSGAGCSFRLLATGAIGLERGHKGLELFYGMDPQESRTVQQIAEDNLAIVRL